MTGHECWMAGASEIVYSILMMQHNFVAPNINFEEPDEYSEKLNITAKTVETELNSIDGAEFHSEQFVRIRRHKQCAGD